MCKWTIPLEQHIAGVTKGTLKIPTKAKVGISNYSGESQITKEIFSVSGSTRKKFDFNLILPCLHSVKDGC